MITNQERFDYLLEVYTEIDHIIKDLVANNESIPDKVVKDFGTAAQELIELSHLEDVVAPRQT